jgi:hypothetical protein
MTEAEAAFAGRQARTTSAFPGKYISVSSYKRDGTAVATPVWFVQDGGRLLVETDAASGKVKRIRRNPVVSVAPCTASGKLRGPGVVAVARVLADSETPAVERALTAKYRADLVIIKPVRFVQSALHLGRPQTKPVIVAITPD